MTKMTRNFSLSQGFSLVELSIVIVITSLLLTSIITLSPTTETQSAIKITEERMDKIEMAIRSHQLIEGHLPCPARRTEPMTSALFGLSTDCSIAAGGVVDVGAGVDTVRIGTVPVRAIGLPDEYTYDGWGNRFKFVVIRDLARTDIFFDGYTTATSRVITILSSSGASINQTNPEQVGYVLISQGKDGEAAYDRGYNSLAAFFVACGTNNGTENCDSDAVFRDQKADYDGGASYFDDIVRWKNMSTVDKEGGYHTYGASPTLQYGKWQYTGAPPAAAASSTGWSTSYPNPVLVNDTSTNASYSGTTFTLGEGRYVINASQPGCGIDGFMTTIYTGTDLPGQAVNGDSTTSTTNGNCTRSYSTHYVDIPPGGSDTYSVWYNSATLNATDGFGRTGTCCYTSGYINLELFELER